MPDEPLCSVVNRPVSSRSHDRIEAPALSSLGDCLHAFPMTSCLHNLGVSARASHPGKRPLKKVLRHRTCVRIVDNEESSTQLNTLELPMRRIRKRWALLRQQTEESLLLLGWVANWPTDRDFHRRLAANCVQRNFGFRPCREAKVDVGLGSGLLRMT
jgi:hypothetical protein